MSLALYASPIEETKEILKTKPTKQKTRKHTSHHNSTTTKEDMNKSTPKDVSELIRKLHSDHYPDSDSDSDDLNVIYPPQKTPIQKYHEIPSIHDHDDIEYDDTNFFSFNDQQKYTHSNHKDKFTYKENFSNLFNENSDQNINIDELSRKMDYIIHMLKDNEEGKTNYVTEELILYCFLGIFMIYLIDSFVKVGKYTR